MKNVKIYTDGINFLGGLKKSKDMRKMWLYTTIKLTDVQIKHFKEYGHATLLVADVPVFCHVDINLCFLNAGADLMDCI